ncbi:uncharacterized protein LOC122611527 isoform X1 [Drosophila teissieri]|uniref:uncharacterized protein LOC122611527 isoform X1 n=1 Tax=Drosophila teissieri TaxID=7243 RepID=UPI001CBA4E7C|nr:uncharacterized protein LOC122611527 isoform X1 [Drosophila teissieri]
MDNRTHQRGRTCKDGFIRVDQTQTRKASCCRPVLKLAVLSISGSNTGPVERLHGFNKSAAAPACKVDDPDLAVLSCVRRDDPSQEPLLRQQVVLCHDDELALLDVGLLLVPLAPNLKAQDIFPGPSPPERLPD